MTPEEIRHELKERGMSRKDLQKAGDFSPRTVARIMTGERSLSDMEVRGLLSYPKKRGPKPKHLQSAAEKL